MLIVEALICGLGITQTDFARITGINRVTINRVLRGHIKPYPKYKRAFCKALGWTGNPEKLFEPIKYPSELEDIR